MWQVGGLHLKLPVSMVPVIFEGRSHCLERAFWDWARFVVGVGEMELPQNIPDSLGIWALGLYLATFAGIRQCWNGKLRNQCGSQWAHAQWEVWVKKLAAIQETSGICSLRELRRQVNREKNRLLTLTLCAGLAMGRVEMCPGYNTAHNSHQLSWLLCFLLYFLKICLLGI